VAHHDADGVRLDTLSDYPLPEAALTEPSELVFYAGLPLCGLIGASGLGLSTAIFAEAFTLVCLFPASCVRGIAGSAGVTVVTGIVLLGVALGHSFHSHLGNQAAWQLRQSIALPLG
jgi:hypothetical protein